MSEYKLVKEIIERSHSKEWCVAKYEWEINEIYQSDTIETCLCGHFPIIEICSLHNLYTDEYADVGNCCVKKFLGLPSDKIFKAIKKIRKDEEKSLNRETIYYAINKNLINDWEYNFLLDTCFKRNLSDKQLETRIKINKKILNNIK